MVDPLRFSKGIWMFPRRNFYFHTWSSLYTKLNVFPTVDRIFPLPLSEHYNFFFFVSVYS